jgi:hypothetical protein
MIGKSGLYVTTAESYNRVVNGAMQHSQENGNTMGGPTGAYYAADQFFFNQSTTKVQSQRVQVVTPNGSRDRYQGFVAATGTPAAGEFYVFETIIEGTRIADLQWGTAQAKQIILRFGWRSPAGTYAISLHNSAANRTWMGSFVITAGQANTDTMQTLVIPGDTTGTWLIDTGVGLGLYWSVATGSTYTTSTAGWQAGNFLSITGATNGIAAANTFHLFDVGLYADPNSTGVAPTWVTPDYASELTACKRYWESVGFTFVTIANPYYNTAWFRATKRVQPALSLVNPNGATVVVVANSPTDGLRQTAASAGVADGYVIANARM